MISCPMVVLTLVFWVSCLNICNDNVIPFLLENLEYNGHYLLNSEYLLRLYLPCTSLLASLHVWEYVCIVSLLDFFSQTTL